MRTQSRPGVFALATLAILFGLGFAPEETRAQGNADMVDQIVAIVGDTAVLRSEIQEEIFRLQAQGAQIPSDRNAMRSLVRQVVDQRINEVLVVLAARRQGIAISEANVNDAVDEQLARIKRQFPSELAFEQALASAGMTSAEFRLQMTDQVRAELLTQRYLSQRVSSLKPVPISDEEVRERFEAQKAALGPRPATVSLHQIVLTPEPSNDAVLSAREKAERALSRARSGEDFGRLAREYSEDPGSREAGGELGWLRRGQLLPAFEDVLFDMRPGGISDLVETAVGYHIIKLERVRGAERFARHILIRPELTSQDVARTRELGEEIADALRGGADVDSLTRLYHDPQEQAVFTAFPQDRLPDDYRQALEGVEPGDVVGPFEIPAPALPAGKFVIIRVDRLSPGGEWKFEDVRDRFRREVQQERMLQQVIEELRRDTYVDARQYAIEQLANLLVNQLSSVLQ